MKLVKQTSTTSSLHATKRGLIGLRYLQGFGMIAKPYLQAAHAVAFNNVDEIHVDQRAATDLHELIGVEFFKQRLDRFADERFAVFSDDKFSTQLFSVRHRHFAARVRQVKPLL